MLASSASTAVWLLIGYVYGWGEIFDLYDLLSFITWEELEVNFRFTRGSPLGRTGLLVFVRELCSLWIRTVTNHKPRSSSWSQLLQCLRRCRVTPGPTQSASTPVFHFLRAANNTVASLYHTLSVVASTTVSSSVVSRCQSLPLFKGLQFILCVCSEGSPP